MASTAQTLKSWEIKHDAKADEAKEINMCNQNIVKLDSSLNALRKCEKLSLSTNAIDRMIGLGGMANLRILSLGRNNIKKLEKLDEVSGTLEQLWISYNEISSLDGLSNMKKLTTLYCSNNQIKSFTELDKIAHLSRLKDVLFVENPMYDEMTRDKGRKEILRHLPRVNKIDGAVVKPMEVEEADLIQ